MKIGIFTDTHYSSKPLTCQKRRNNLSLGKIKDAYELFKKEKCDLVVSLGDLIDIDDSHELEKKHLAEIRDVISSYDIPTVCMMGNHDAFAFSVDEFYGTLRGYAPQTIEQEGKLLLFLDACYFKSGRHYAPGDSDWTDTFLPNSDELNSLLQTYAEEIVIFIHQNIDPAVQKDHRLDNADEIHRMILNSRNVKKVFQGHYHTGNISTYGDLTYYTLPAVCENNNAYFVFEI